MKNLSILLFALLIIPTIVFSQTKEFNLESENLHKKVRKTRSNYYMYDDDSGGFILRSISINRYNDDGNLEETFSQYNGSYGKTDPVKKLYNYDSKNQLISIKDISNNPGKFSNNTLFTYNNDGNIIKKESVYTDGSKYVTAYTYDRKERITTIKEYSKENVLSSETLVSYNGKTRTETRTSFNTKDNSIYGTYTTTYKNDIKTNYNANSKYSNSTTTYTYDDEGNILKSISDGKNSYLTTYDYVYDRKDNWIKKHYRSGKFQYFYFREIMLEDGDISGSTDFDANFIKLHGNFANVSVVPLVMKKTKTTNNNSNTNNNSSSNSSTFSNKTWNYDYIYINKEVKSLLGSATIKSNDSRNINVNSNIGITVKFGESKFDFNFNITKFTDLGDKYEYTFKNDQNANGLLWIYKNVKSLKDDKSGVTFLVNGLLTIAEVGQPTMSMYLK